MLPMTVVALKMGATTGFALGMMDYLTQLVRKKALPKSGEEEPISAREMIKAFAVGSLLGNFAGTPIYCKLAFGKLRAGWISAMIWAEAAWSPFHIAILKGRTEYIEAKLPSLFGKMAFSFAGGYLVCDLIVHLTMVGPVKLKQVMHVAQVISDVGGTVCGFSLFVFCNKYADYQRNKTIKDNSPAVSFIQTMATGLGQLCGNFTAIALGLTPWLPVLLTGPSWYYSAAVITPGFFYCTALNIEAGVKCEEVFGRAPLDTKGKIKIQKRSSILQTLPLGALPSGFCKGHHINGGVIVACKFLAAACASLYIAYQQEVWEKFRDAEKERFGGRMADDNDSDQELAEMEKKYREEVIAKVTPLLLELPSPLSPLKERKLSSLDAKADAGEDQKKSPTADNPEKATE